MDADFHLSLLHQLNAYRQDCQLCDVELVVSGHSVPAHRAVLAARSKYFEGMFLSSFRERSGSAVDLTNSIENPEVLALIIDYMYTGKITITSTNLHGVLAGANLLLIEQLLSICSQYLLRNLSPINCVQIWMIADMFHLEDVCEVAHAMVRSRFADYICHQDFLTDIPCDFLLKMAKENVMDFVTPSEIGELLKKWTGKELESRTSYAVRILETLKDKKANKDLLSDHSVCSLLDKVASSVSSDILSDCLKSLVSWKKECLEPNSGHRVICSWILKAKRVSQHSSTSRAWHSYDQSLEVFMYEPKEDNWYSREFELPGYLRKAKKIIGAMDNCLVLRLMNKELLLGVCQESSVEWKEIHGPKLYDVPFLKRTYHIYRGKLFCLILYANNLSHVLEAHALDTTSLEWGLEVKKEYSFDGEGYFYSSTASLRGFLAGEALVVVMYINSKHQIARLTYDESLNRFEVSFSATPATEDLIPIGPELMDMSVSESDHSLLLLKNWLCVEYNLQSERWSSHVLAMTPTPDLQVVPFENNPCHKINGQNEIIIPVDLGFVSPLKGSGDGLAQGLICVQLLGPYISKMWKGTCTIDDAPEMYEWVELKPPPTEGMRQFWNCEISESVLKTFGKAIYDISDGQSCSGLSKCKVKDPKSWSTYRREVLSVRAYRQRQRDSEDEYSPNEDDDNFCS